MLRILQFYRHRECSIINMSTLVPTLSLVSSTSTSLSMTLAPVSKQAVFHVLKYNSETVEFEPCYTGLRPGFEVKGLTPGVRYMFKARTQDIQSDVFSEWGKVAAFETMSAIPDRPDPPECLVATANALHLLFKLPEGKNNGLVNLLVELSLVSPQAFETVKTIKLDDDEIAVALRPKPNPFSKIAKNDLIDTAKKGRTVKVVLTALQPSTDYLVRCRLKNAEGISAVSDSILGTTSHPPPHKISGVTFAATAESISLQWVNDYSYPVLFRSELNRLDYHASTSQIEPFALFTGLRAFETYHATIFATSQNGESEPYHLDITTSSLPPSAPLFFRCTVAAARFITLEWNAPEFQYGLPIDSYSVEQVEISELFYELEAGLIDAPVLRAMPIYVGKEPTCVITSVYPASSYSFRVGCLNKLGHSPFSSILLVHTLDDVPDRAQIEEVLALPGGTSVTLRFPCVNSYSAPILNYNVRVTQTKQATAYSTDKCTADYISSFIATHDVHFPLKSVSSDNNYVSLIVHDLTPRSEYQFELQSFSSFGASAWSEISKTVLTLEAPPTRPNPPRLVIASTTFIHLQWHAAKVFISPGDDAPIVNYNLEASFDGKIFHSLVQNYAPCDFIHSELNPGTVIYYRLLAENSAGQSPFSSVSSFRTLADVPRFPLPPQIVDVQSTSIRLKWCAVSFADQNGAPIKQFKLVKQVLRSEASIPSEKADWDLVFVGGSFDLSAKVAKLKPSTTYAFRIFAVNDVGPSQTSQFTVATTKDPVPSACQNFNYLQTKSGDLQFSWDAPEVNSSNSIPSGYIVEVALDTRDHSYLQIAKQCEKRFLLSRQKLMDLTEESLSGTLFFRVAGFSHNGIGNYSASRKWCAPQVKVIQNQKIVATTDEVKPDELQVIEPDDLNLIPKITSAAKRAVKVRNIKPSTFLGSLPDTLKIGSGFFAIVFVVFFWFISNQTSNQ